MSFAHRFLFVLVVLSLGQAGVLHAEVVNLDLGARAPNGAAAVLGMHNREIAVVHALACDDEVAFLQRIVIGEMEGNWPIEHLMAKAAFITGRFAPPANTVFSSFTADSRFNFDIGDGCAAAEATPNLERWRWQFFKMLPKTNVEVERFPGARDIWTQVELANSQSRYVAKISWLREGLAQRYLQLFGDACRDAVPKLPGFAEPPLIIRLTPECLMRQIRVVIENEKLGAWKIDGETIIPKMPGTSADKLPCPTDWALINEGVLPGDWTAPWDGIKGVEGDWDMAVIEYSRLAYLLYSARAARTELTGDANPALHKINHWLLTLRGEPATEIYHPFWSCGNPGNSFGSAEDYLNDKDVYNKELDREVSGKNDGEDSFWKKLWKIFRFFLAVAAIGFAIGLALGLAAGAALAGGLAAAAAAVGLMVAVISISSIFIAGIQETENHLFMQNSSKYLKNKLMMAEQRIAGNRAGFDKIAGENEKVRLWLLNRMQQVIAKDFVEYNSKPYVRLTHQSILNLADFACDVTWSWDTAHDPPPGAETCDPKDFALKTASASVFDLSATKISLGSSQGRRIVPFRRLVKENTRYRDPWINEQNGTTEPPKRVLQFGSGADHLVAALQFWAGTTHHGPDGKASTASVGEMLWHATSRYRPHEIILDLATNKATPIEQHFKHHTTEHYSSGSGWLLTAGGDSEHQAQGLVMNIGWLGFLGARFTIYSLGPTDDKGVGVPTTLMAAGQVARRDTYTEFLRFEGQPEIWAKDGTSVMQSFSENRCVTGSFACGLRLEIPRAIDECLKPAPTASGAPRELRFLASTDCAEFAPSEYSFTGGFFLAVYQGTCKRGVYKCLYSNWGFVEVAEYADFDSTLEKYRDELIARNKGNFGRWASTSGREELKFWSVARNREIEFVPYDEDFDEDCRACGSIVNGDGDGPYTITNPRRPGQSIGIDFRDAENPQRSGQGGLVLDGP